MIDIPFFDKREEEWVKVLKLMYENRVVTDPDLTAGFMSAEDAGAMFKSARFFNHVEPNIEGDVDDVMQDLELSGFVKVNEINNVKLYGLTNEGFQFAHNIKAEQQRRFTNKLLIGMNFLLVTLTFLLVILTLLLVWPNFPQFRLIFWGIYAPG